MRLFDTLPNFIFTPQVKRGVIYSNKHSTYELPHELPNDLINLRKLGKIRKISKLHRIIQAENRCKQKTADKKKLKPCRIALLHIKTRVCLIYPAHDCPRKQFPTPNLSQSPSNLIFWTILVTMRLFTQLQFKIRATKLRQSAKFYLTW